MLLAEFTLDHPILRETLRSRPGLRVVWERSDTSGERRVVLCWVEGDDFDGLDAALEADPTVADPTVLTEVGGRRLYRFDLADEGHQKSVYPVMVEESGVIRSLTADASGWHFRVEFPTRVAFDRFREVCREYDLDISLGRILAETPAERDAAFGLTAPQREALRAAVDTGYLSIPREASLAELGDALDISQNAASERFRRGVETLVQNTVIDGES
ncbi:helix-turn-helix domain-containing protein [Halobium salinum]|uniref:Helix-turn-helix domain-containing protein n=1 Tax=Halobium salinum TaxID=1364940 RepID=A0ABD5PDN2_9EURY|nr:helix-turn-helix domain-containing protein [Halobium salinum]